MSREFRRRRNAPLPAAHFSAGEIESDYESSCEITLLARESRDFYERSERMDERMGLAHHESCPSLLEDDKVPSVGLLLART